MADAHNHGGGHGQQNRRRQPEPWSQQFALAVGGIVGFFLALAFATIADRMSAGISQPHTAAAAVAVFIAVLGVTIAIAFGNTRDGGRTAAWSSTAAIVLGLLVWFAWPDRQLSTVATASPPAVAVAPVLVAPVVPVAPAVAPTTVAPATVAEPPKCDVTGVPEMHCFFDEPKMRVYLGTGNKLLCTSPAKDVGNFEYEADAEPNSDPALDLPRGRTGSIWSKKGPNDAWLSLVEREEDCHPHIDK